MKKTLISLLTIAFIICFAGGYALAAPLTDYSGGKVSVDVFAMPAEISIHDKDFAKKTDLGLGVTLGFGNNWAGQFNYMDLRSGAAGIAQTKVFEFNLLGQDKYNKDISYFIGGLTGKTSETVIGADKTYLQGGVQLSHEIFPRVTGYTSYAIGKDLKNWKIGLSYQIAKDVDLNVQYIDLQMDKQKIQTLEDVQVKGVQYGLTFRF